jgi:hypothetical protein
MNRRLLPALLLAFLVASLAACGASVGGMKKTDAMTEYGARVRWNAFDDAWTFVDPAVRLTRPLTDLERARFKQIEVTGYDLRSRNITPDGLQLDQDVEIRLINRNTQVERVITDHQHWTYDPPSKTWWLVSGLPDFTATQ